MSSPARRILITGASGFIGQALLQACQQQAQSDQPQPDQAQLHISTLQRPTHDLMNPASLLEPCRAVDTIYHLAAYAHVNHSNHQALMDTNVTGTANLLQAAVAGGVRHLIYVSSILADPAFDSPRSAYGQAKYQAEQLLAQAHRDGALRVTIVRPVNVYGPGMKGSLMSLLRLIDKGVMPPLPAFRQHFSLVGVQDLCQLLLLVAQRADDTDAPTQAPVYPVTDGQQYTIKAVESAMREALGKTPWRWATPQPLFYLGALGMEVLGRVARLRNAPGLRTWRAMTRQALLDDSASRADLGYNPQASFYSTLPQIVAHYRMGR